MMDEQTLKCGAGCRQHPRPPSPARESADVGSVQTTSPDGAMGSVSLRIGVLFGCGRKIDGPVPRFIDTFAAETCFGRALGFGDRSKGASESSDSE